MSILLLGDEDMGSFNLNANTFYCQYLQAIKGGSLNTISVYANTSGGVKVALYDDSSGPNNRLTVNNSGTSVIVGWNDIIVPSVSVAGGTYYWLAVLTNTSGAARNDASGGTCKFKALTYSSGLPDPAGTGFTDNSFDLSIAGYGSTGDSLFSLGVGF